MNSNAMRLQHMVLMGVAILATTACGGGGGGESPGAQPQPSAPTAVSGVVLLPAGTTAPATVCYDTNRDGDCDAAEPTTTTDSTGSYTLSGLPAMQADDAALLAQVPAGPGAAYTLKSPVSRPSFITAITTLLQTGVSQGMTRQAAETAMARQLQVDATSLYGNHRTLAAGVQRAWHETFDTVIVQLLQEGTPLRVGPPAATGAGYQVESFYYQDATNHYLAYSYTTGSIDPATSLQSEYTFARDVRNSQPAPIYASDFMWALTPSGWKVNFPEAFKYQQTTGNPYVMLSPTGHVSIASTHDENVAGQSVAGVVARTADGTNGNTFSTITLPSGFTPAGTMPAGARLRTLRFAQMARPASYLADSDRVAVNQASLAALTAAYPPLGTGTAVTEQNTALMGRRASSWVDGSASGQSCATRFSTNSSGIRICVDADLRATFDASGTTIQLQLCDYAFSGTPASQNCRAAGSAPLVASTLGGATPSLRLDPMPAIAAPFLGGRVLIENQGRIYRATPSVPVTTAPPLDTITQLNRAAFTALANSLGLTVPNPTFTTPSPFMGVWQLNAGLQSRCDAVLVDAAGDLYGACQSPTEALAIGTVSATGFGSFSIPGYYSTYTGQFAPTSAAGSWSNSITLHTGTWSATKY